MLNNAFDEYFNNIIVLNTMQKIKKINKNIFAILKIFKYNDDQNLKIRIKIKSMYKCFVISRIKYNVKLIYFKVILFIKQSTKKKEKKKKKSN